MQNKVFLDKGHNVISVHRANYWRSPTCRLRATTSLVKSKRRALSYKNCGLTMFFNLDNKVNIDNRSVTLRGKSITEYLPR